MMDAARLEMLADAALDAAEQQRRRDDELAQRIGLALGTRRPTFEDLPRGGFPVSAGSYRVQGRSELGAREIEARDLPLREPVVLDEPGHRGPRDATVDVTPFEIGAPEHAITRDDGPVALTPTVVFASSLPTAITTPVAISTPTPAPTRPARWPWVAAGAIAALIALPFVAPSVGTRLGLGADDVRAALIDPLVEDTAVRPSIAVASIATPGDASAERSSDAELPPVPTAVARPRVLPTSPLGVPPSLAVPPAPPRAQPALASHTRAPWKSRAIVQAKAETRGIAPGAVAGPTEIADTTTTDAPNLGEPQEMNATPTLVANDHVAAPTSVAVPEPAREPDPTAPPQHDPPSDAPPVQEPPASPDPSSPDEAPAIDDPKPVDAPRAGASADAGAAQ